MVVVAVRNEGDGGVVMMVKAGDICSCSDVEIV
jgi:hypothetical protein